MQFSHGNSTEPLLQGTGKKRFINSNITEGKASKVFTKEKRNNCCRVRSPRKAGTEEETIKNQPPISKKLLIGF